jgi:glycosyltransferase involved in cell wall biosynthesis
MKTITLNKKPNHRVLHVVGDGMVRAGTETWLMNILRHIDRDCLQMDFLVHTTQPCAYDEEIRSLGSRLIHCLPPSQPWLYAHDFCQILQEDQPYDIVHSHVHYFNGYVLRLAHQAGVTTRIAHSHTNTAAHESNSGLYRQLYLSLMKSWITRYATVGLACSEDAASDLFGTSWKADPRWQIHYCGIDLTPFQNFVNTIDVRAELGIPNDAFVIGHVGRFNGEKNHQFVIEIAAEVAKLNPKMRLLLVGEGSLKFNIKQKVAQLGLTDHVIFTGSRSDVPRLMLGAMDAFVFPSLYEGLGLVLIEAQAAGLPCVFSDVIPQEADLVKSLVKRMSLLQPASAWAKAILAQREVKEKVTQKAAFNLVEKSAFNIQKSARDLENLYLHSLQTLVKKNQNS